MTAVIFGTMVLCFAMGVPIAFALIAAALAGALYDGTIFLSVIPQRIFAGLDTFPLLAAPLFILAGEVMTAGGMSIRLVRFAGALVGHLRGSLAMIAVLASMLFAGVSGSATADTAAVGAIMIPAMVRQGYDRAFAAAIQAAAGTIGPIIPPSVIMIIFGFIASVSVAALFVGGVVPGLLIGLALLLMAHLQARKGGDVYAGGERAGWTRLGQSAVAALPALGLPVIIFGGILGGVFTPTEAAAVAAVYAFAIEFLVHREITVSEIPRILRNTVMVSSVVMLVVGASSLFAWMITFAEIPQRITAFLLGISSSAVAFLLIVNVVLLIAGTFLEAIAAMIILVPILFPAAMEYGLHPVHFGVVVTVNLCIGMITPPLGVTLFVTSGISGCSIAEIVRPVVPLFLVMVGVLLLITYVPETVLFLPRIAGLL